MMNAYDKQYAAKYAATQNLSPSVGSAVGQSLSTSIRETLGATEVGLSTLNEKLEQILFCLRGSDAKPQPPNAELAPGEVLYVANRNAELVRRALDKAETIINVLGA